MTPSTSRLFRPLVEVLVTDQGKSPPSPQLLKFNKEIDQKVPFAFV